MLRARLSKRDNRTILCAVPTCTGVLGHMPYGLGLVSLQQHRLRPIWLLTTPGFTRGTDGIWRLSQYALRERAYGRPPAYRRPPNSHQGMHVKADSVYQLLKPAGPMVCPSPRCRADGAPQLVDTVALVTEHLKRRGIEAPPSAPKQITNAVRW